MMARKKGRSLVSRRGAEAQRRREIFRAKTQRRKGVALAAKPFQKPIVTPVAVREQPFGPSLFFAPSRLRAKSLSSLRLCASA
jgi:hypothetical protein